MQHQGRVSRSLSSTDEHQHTYPVGLSDRERDKGLGHVPGDRRTGLWRKPAQAGERVVENGQECMVELRHMTSQMRRFNSCKHGGNESIEWKDWYHKDYNELGNALMQQFRDASSTDDWGDQRAQITRVPFSGSFRSLLSIQQPRSHPCLHFSPPGLLLGSLAA